VERIEAVAIDAPHAIPPSPPPSSRSGTEGLNELRYRSLPVQLSVSADTGKLWVTKTKSGHGDKEAWAPPPSPLEGLTFFFLR
jgi:hypothetical protein